MRLRVEKSGGGAEDTPGRYGARPFTDREMLGAFAFLVLFGLPFAAGGTWALVQAAVKLARGEMREALMLGAMGSAFALVGFGLIAGSLWARGKVSVDAAAAFAHPDEPWKWRADWARGYALDGGPKEAWGLAFFAVLWNLIAFPGGVLAFQAATAKGQGLAWIALLFPVVGALLAAQALTAFARAHKQGVARLDLAAVPVPVGRTLAGTVRTHLAAPPEDGFTLVLSALRTERSGPDDDMRTHVVWQEEAHAKGQLSSDGNGVHVIVPVAIRIPADAPSTDHSNASDELAWKLEVRAATPGIDYSAGFEVPVYRTEASFEPETARSAAHLRPVAFSAPDLPAGAPRPEPHSPIEVSHDGEGLVILFPAARNKGAAAAVTAFGILWTAITLFLAMRAPFVFPIVFGLFDLLIGYIALTLWLEAVRVRVNPAGVKVARGFGEPGEERLVPAREVADVKLAVGMSSGTRVWWDLSLACSNGRSVPLGGGMRDRHEAEWLAAQVKDALAKAR